MNITASLGWVVASVVIASLTVGLVACVIMRSFVLPRMKFQSYPIALMFCGVLSGFLNSRITMQIFSGMYMASDVVEYLRVPLSTIEVLVNIFGAALVGVGYILTDIVLFRFFQRN